ncbi:MAG: peptidoglycan editing factor PgeF [Chloroherpetonaceae bacterium]
MFQQINSLLRPNIFQAFPNVVALQTTREGGVSQGAFRSLNLGLSSGDARETVLKNRAILCRTIGIEPTQLVLSHQVHGDAVLIAEKGGHYDEYDAHITNRVGVFLAVSIADCAPILIYDRTHNAVAAVHAGWRGTAKAILYKTLLKMNETFGTEGKDCYAFIGACISSDAYEVGDDVAKHFPSQVKRYDSARGKFLLDLKMANRMQLEDFGVLPAHIEVSPHCTYLEHNRFFSFRYDKGKTGRMFALIGLKQLQQEK